MVFRKAAAADLPAIAAIYADTHTEIEAGRLSVGWIRSIYPVPKTAEAALARDDLYVAEDGGEIVGTAIINRRQEEMYAGAPWQFDAPDDQVMVLHTLVIAPKHAGKGYATRFVAFLSIAPGQQAAPICGWTPTPSTCGHRRCTPAWATPPSAPFPAISMAFPVSGWCCWKRSWHPAAGEAGKRRRPRCKTPLPMV